MKKLVVALLCIVLCLSLVCVADVTDFSVDEYKIRVSGQSSLGNYVGARVLSGSDVLFYTQTYSDSVGEFEFDLNLAEEIDSGTYELEIIADDVTYNQEFSIPDNHIYLETEKAEDDDNIGGGNDVSNAKVSVSNAVKIINKTKISGKVENFSIDGNALLTITEKNVPENIIYINEETLNENGEFEFLFSISESISDCDVTVYYEDASGKTVVSESDLKYAYVSGISSLEVLGEEAVLTADITNNSMNEVTYMLIVYTHDEQGFVNSVTAGELMTMEDSEVSSNGNTLTAMIPSGTKKVSGVVWSSFDDVIPITDVLYENIGGAEQ